MLQCDGWMSPLRDECSIASRRYLLSSPHETHNIKLCLGYRNSGHFFGQFAASSELVARELRLLSNSGYHRVSPLRITRFRIWFPLLSTGNRIPQHRQGFTKDGIDFTVSNLLWVWRAVGRRRDCPRLFGRGQVQEQPVFENRPHIAYVVQLLDDQPLAPPSI